MRRIGRVVINAAVHAGAMTIFALRLIAVAWVPFTRPRDLAQQIYAAGVLSLVIILVAGGFVGLVLGLQGYTILSSFNATESLGVMVALSLVRELGPVVTALLFAGRAGSSITAEIALMKTTEQLSALEMMAVDPIRRVMAPRLLASIIAVPILAAMFSFVGILGGYFIGVVVLEVDAASYWGQIAQQMDAFDDVMAGMIKAVAFGAVIALIAVFEGHYAEPTAKGMAQATTQTVVISSLAVLALDFVLTAVMFGT
ncbi:MAG TPA: lipid asymmetry maintenance ABC transporter permease subunit MlaE [Halothiobacillaceae bacterium]|nr:lipid asymmetry maintenance ABC transporter permease subunit MlaE [Halothiobacillaceae bacterium]